MHVFVSSKNERLLIFGNYFVAINQVAVFGCCHPGVSV
jgi:hypothetical protein